MIDFTTNRPRRWQPSSVKLLHFPVTVIVDTREGLPYEFLGLRADAEFGRCQIVIPTERKGLRTGDYSLAGWENAIAIERKSLPDLYGSVIQERERFQHELQRFQEGGYNWAAVVIEASWHDIVTADAAYSNVREVQKHRNKSVYRSILAWMQRYPKVHWITAPDRRFAEITTFRLLERFLKDHRPGKLYEK